MTQPFTPPTPQQVREHLERHPAHGPSWTAVWLPWVVLGIAMMLALINPNPLLAPWPWALLAVTLGYLFWRGRRMTRLHREVRQVQEMAALRWTARALRHTWRLVPRLVQVPPLYGTNMAIMADCLDRLNAFDAAHFLYDHLIDRMPAQSPDALLLRLRRAIVQIQTEQLLDADASLRSLRGPVEEAGQPLVALYRLATLLQQVHTHHYDDATAGSGRLVRELRPLGVSAGFGFGLVALAYHHQLHHGGHAADVAHRRARWWWASATTLMPAAAMIRRFPALAQLQTEASDG